MTNSIKVQVYHVVAECAYNEEIEDVCTTYSLEEAVSELEDYNTSLCEDDDTTVLLSKRVDTLKT